MGICKMVYFINYSKPRFLFVTSFKVGFSSIGGTLEKSFPNLVISFEKVNREEMKIKNKFFLVRNPFARTVSCYFAWVYGWNKLDYSKTEGGLLFKNQRIILRAFRKKMLPESLSKISFNEFVKILPKIIQKDHHFRPQIDSLCDKSKLKYFSLLKLENINDDWKKLCKILNKKMILLHRFKTKHKNYRFYYDEKTKNIIHKLYKEDFKKFNYKF